MNINTVKEVRYVALDHVPHAWPLGNTRGGRPKGLMIMCGFKDLSVLYFRAISMGKYPASGYVAAGDFKGGGNNNSKSLIHG